MGKLARILAVVMITVGLLAGAIIPSIPVCADIAGAPDYYRLDYVVNASANDALEGYDIGSGNYSTETTYILGVANDYGDPAYDANTGVIFSSVAVPNTSQGQVLSAYLSFYSDGEGERDFTAYIYGEDTPNAEPYINSENGSPSVSARNRTTAYRYINADTSEGARYYVDVTPVVEELVASPNWSQGGNMSFLLMHDDEAGSYAFATGSYDSGGVTVPELTIYYAPISETHYVIPFGHEDTIDAGISQTINMSEDCAVYHAMNAQENDSTLIGFQYYGMNAIGTANYIDHGFSMLVIDRSIIGFNTSVLPDDASIIDVSLFMNPYVHLSATNNSSIIVTKYTDRSILARFMEIGSPFFNRSKFEGNLGEFDSRDFPQYDGMLPLPNNSDIVVKTVLTGINSYIDKTSFTLFGFRDILDINDVCPDGITSNGSATLFRLIPPEYYQLSSYGNWEPPAPSWLVVDIGSAPIIPTGPVSVMMTIQALIFALGGILGILALLMKPDVFSFGLRVGLLLGLAIMTVVGVAMLESIIVAMTR